MASGEHLSLSGFIKSVHEDLRRNSKIVGAQEAWKEHCKNQEILGKYSSAMQELATNHWEGNFGAENKAISRVKWVHDYCRDYFNGAEEILRQRQREIEIAQKVELCVDNLCVISAKNVYKLLDVGSCYNPFKIYEFFDVTAIDIAPACVGVSKCDFLNVGVCDTGNLLEPVITDLPICYFDVVVFSLFLEYLPSPGQRLICCEKAHSLLQCEGILIVITPDSKHVGANAKIMKSWRFILAKIGFSRVKYEKLPYLHCMVFRKSVLKQVAERWALLRSEREKLQFFDEIVIPQDFTLNKADQ